MTRNRYVDLLRVLAIGGVVYGHWLLVSVVYRDGTLSGADAVDYIAWGRWVTWAFQVMPVFFLVGGYVNSLSWEARRARGQNWTWWVRERAVRLLWPTAVYVLFALVAVSFARLAGVPGPELAEAAWLAALHLWFLPVYLLVIALTPVMFEAHTRWGLAVPLVMAACSGLVDLLMLGEHVRLLGYANYLLVWGSIHQWGFAWRDGRLTSPRWRLWAMSGAGAALLAGFVTSRAFQVDMVGSGNTNPPSIALLAFAAAQTGLVIAAEPWFSRVLARPERWRPVQRLNSLVMNVYLWHFVPVLVVALAFYTTGVLPQPGIGSSEWFAFRLVWFALLTAVFVPFVTLVTWAEQPMRRLPAGQGRPGSWSPALLVLGLLAAAVGLGRLAVDGFAPDGRWPTTALAGFVFGLAAIVFAGRTPGEDAPLAEGATRQEA